MRTLREQRREVGLMLKAIRLPWRKIAEVIDTDIHGIQGAFYGHGWPIGLLKQVCLKTGTQGERWRYLLKPPKRELSTAAGLLRLNRRLSSLMADALMFVTAQERGQTE